MGKMWDSRWFGVWLCKSSSDCRMGANGRAESRRGPVEALDPSMQAICCLHKQSNLLLHSQCELSAGRSKGAKDVNSLRHSAVHSGSHEPLEVSKQYTKSGKTRETAPHNSNILIELDTCQVCPWTRTHRRTALTPAVHHFCMCWHFQFYTQLRN